MATFIDDARDFRSNGASRKQLVSFIKMHGVDDDRAELLADRLDVELGLGQVGVPARGDLAAPPRPAAVGAGDGIRTDEQVIDLRDGAAFPLVAAADPTMAISRVQRLIDVGVPRREIQDFLQRSGVTATEAAYISQTTPRTQRGEIDYAQPVRRRKRQRDGSTTFAVLTIGIGLAMVLFGLFAFRDGAAFGWREPWFWFTVAGVVTALSGMKWMIDSSV